MNVVTNRKLLVLLGPVVAVVMFAAAVKMASGLMSREYQEPSSPPSVTVGAPPGAEGLAAEKADPESDARAKP